MTALSMRIFGGMIGKSNTSKYIELGEGGPSFAPARRYD